MKKTFALLLALVMMFSLVACSGSNSSDSPSTSDSPSASDSPSTGGNTNEPYIMNFELPTMMTIPSEDAIQKVEDAINDYLLNELGITEFKIDYNVISVSDYETNLNMQLAAHEQHDVVLVQKLADMVDNGYLLDLSPYLDNEMKETMEVLPESLPLCGQLNGTPYMLPRYFGTVLDWKFIYNKEMVDPVYDTSKINSIEDLGDCLAALKVAYPTEHFLCYTNQFPQLYNFASKTSILGTYFATVGESPEIVNYFATDAFKNAVEKAYEYMQLGYADPEGSANTLSHDLLTMSGSAKGVIMGHSTEADRIAEMFDRDNTYGATFGAKTIAISDLSTDTLGWGIAYTCQNPSAAATFLNLLYTDQFIWSTIIWGVEGESYVWNEDHTAVRFPDGLDMNSVPYTAQYSCGILGNGFLGFPWEDRASSTYSKDLMEQAWAPPLYGFTPSSENVSAQIAAISNVYSQYYDALVYGDVNPDEYLPQFLSALETAGINEVIADYQAQADKWLAGNGK